MAQVDSENSTAMPADPTRRSFLSTAAGVAAGSTVLALATIPTALATAAPAGLAGPGDAPEVDGEVYEEMLTNAYDEIVSQDAKIEEYHIAISDDDERCELQGYLDAEDARSAAIVRLCEIPAGSWRGARAKAAALMMPQIREDDDCAGYLGQSLADDVLRLTEVMGS